MAAGNAHITLLFLIFLFLATVAGKHDVPSAAAANGPAICSDELRRDTRDHKVVMIGERHGSEEIAFVMICVLEGLLKKGARVLVGFEMPAELETDLQNYMNSPAEDPQNWILNNWFWRDSVFQDGRRSRAMLHILRQAWRWKKAGRDISVHTLDIPYDPAMRKAAGISVNRRNRFMAARIAALMEKEKPDHVVILVGRGHARTRPYDDPAYAEDPPIPLQLKHLETWSIDVWAVAGARWSCFRRGEKRRLSCSTGAVRPPSHHPEIGVPVYRHLTGDPQAAFDAELILPVFTPSPPAWKDFTWQDCDRVPPKWAPCAGKARPATR